MSELKPCPFCWSDNVEFRERTHWTGKRSVVIAVDLLHWRESLPGDARSLIKITGAFKEIALSAWNARADKWH